MRKTSNQPFEEENAAGVSATAFTMQQAATLFRAAATPGSVAYDVEGNEASIYTHPTLGQCIRLSCKAESGHRRFIVPILSIKSIKVSALEVP